VIPQPDRQAVDVTDTQIGQAIYTWRKLRTGQVGYGFAAVSPGLKNQLTWLEANTTPITGFVGNSRPTNEQREAYKPVGRHVSGSTAFAYRKEDAGLDGYNRSGNYLVHILVAPTACLGLSDTLRIPQRLWISAAVGRLNTELKLNDISLAELRRDLDSPKDAIVQDPNRVLDALYELIQGRTIDVTGWLEIEILSLLAVLPAWGDYSARLLPSWSDGGRHESLELASVREAIPKGVEDRRSTPLNQELSDLRQTLLRAVDVADLRSLLSPSSAALPPLARASSPQELQPAGSVARRETEAAAARVKENLQGSIRRWLTVSAQDLPASERVAILETPNDVVEIFERTNQQIPSSRKPDTLALSLLERCDEVNPRSLARMLPVEDQAVAMYVSLCQSTAVLEAAILLNADRSRSIDLTFQKNVLATTVQHVIARSRVDEDIYKGLIRSLQISSLGAGSFARRVLLAKGIDFEYLYRKLIPAASSGRDDALLSLACINPDAFVSWLEVPEPYEGALVNVLRQETRQKAWERIGRFAGRWRKH
jgi:hypothetical protein